VDGPSYLIGVYMYVQWWLPILGLAENLQTSRKVVAVIPKYARYHFRWPGCVLK
jgi:hypothetical protein